MDGRAVREGVREEVSDDGSEEAAEVGGLKLFRVADSASEANGFERVGFVVEFNEGVHARWVGAG